MQFNLFETLLLHFETVQSLSHVAVVSERGRASHNENAPWWDVASYENLQCSHQKKEKEIEPENFRLNLATE